jgi:hypothetical protein
MSWIFQKLAKLAGIRLPIWVLAVVIGAFCGGIIIQHFLLRYAVDEIGSLSAGNTALTASVESKTKENELLKGQMMAEVAICQEQLADRAVINRILPPVNIKPAAPEAPSATTDKPEQKQGIGADGGQALLSTEELISHEVSRDVVDFINGKL